MPTGPWTQFLPSVEPLLTDVVYSVSDPVGTPGNQVSTWAQVLAAMGFNISSVVLANDDIKALPTTPVEIVPAMPGFYVVPLVTLLEASFAVGYSNVDTNALLGLGPAGFPAAGAASNGSLQIVNNAIAGVTNLSDFLTNAGISLFVLSAPFVSVVGSIVVPQVGDSWLGQAWTIAMANAAAGALTGGNAGNKLAVTQIWAKVPTLV